MSEKQPAQVHKDTLLAGLSKWVTDHPLWPEYVAEGEFEEGGVDYWKLFETPQDVEDDFKLVVEELQ